jgi:hypothetical protein
LSQVSSIAAEARDRTVFREPIMTALERWVENGAAPDTVMAAE